MALPELTKKRVEILLTDFCEKRVPPHVRNQVKLTFEFRGNSATLFEARPVWNDPTRWTHTPVAQFRLDPGSLEWSLYCCDRNSKWHLYQGANPTSALETLLSEVDRDPTRIFWG